MVGEALDRSHRGFFITRAVDELSGDGSAVEIPLRLTYSRSAIRNFVATIAAALHLSPGGARLAYRPSDIRASPGRTGREVQARLLRSELAAALIDPRRPRELAIPVRAVAPSVTAADLSRRYPRTILVDRAGFWLMLYKHLRLAQSYPIAVGMIGLETPAGLYHKQIDPWWAVPNSAWAGALAGRLIPPGPQDPLKARWLGFDGAAGIHGINPSEYSPIGHDASHGCIRMTIPDVISLYDHVSVGPPYTSHR
jgi:lipoprotein-anchoring transpeptidase ErfK/SrfK